MESSFASRPAPGTFAVARWWRIVPLAFITFSLAYVDRANIGLAAASGMNTELGISKGMFSLISAAFFIGYFLFQIPGAMYAQRRSVKRLILGCLVVWGICAVLTGVVRNAYGLLVVRTLLGAAEAAVIPGMLIYLSRWFTRSERSRANTLLMLGNPVTVLWMSVLTGYIIHAIGWRRMFVWEGLPSVAWALIWWAIAPETPAEVKWLSDEEKDVLSHRLAGEQSGIKPVKNYREAFQSPVALRMCLQYFSWSMGAYGFILWLPTILREGSTIGIVATGWLSSVPYLLAIVAMLGASILSDRLGNRKTFVWAFLLLGALGFFGCFLSPGFWVSYALLIIAGASLYAPYGPFFAIIPEVFPENVAGGAIALVNAAGAAGAFFGTYAVGYLNGLTGKPIYSHLFMAADLGLAVILTLSIRDGRRAPAAG